MCRPKIRWTVCKMEFVAMMHELHAPQIPKCDFFLWSLL